MIHLAKQEDLPKVVDLYVQALEEINHPHLPKCKKPILADSIYKNWLVAPCFVVKVDDEVVGAASLSLNVFPWSDEPYLGNIMVYVLKKHRNSDILKELYEAIQKFADLQGVSYCDTFVGMDKIDARLRLSRRHNLTNSGIFITYRGDNE